MSLILRPYQQSLDDDIVHAWNYARNVLAVCPTGGGKTVIFSNRMHNHNGAAVAIAHRQELGSQISLALARFGIRHRIIAPNPVIKWIVQLHVMELGASFYDPTSRYAVAGVDTLLSRKDSLSRWLQQVTLCVMDEAHHVLKENKWGRAFELFPNAYALGVTAETERADGKGLGRHADGIFDILVEGPCGRDLINQGYLTDYRIFAPPSGLNLEGIGHNAQGDFNQAQLAARTKQSHVMGDIVEHYCKHVMGQLGVSFLPTIELATETANKFRLRGVPAEVVSSKTPDKLRVEILRRFRRREVWNLVNVDLFGEGFDLPAIEVVSMGRATDSYNLFKQQFGRALRILEGKKIATIFDHVGNMRHGLPDRPKPQTLDRREKRTRGTPDPDRIPMKTCHECTNCYEAFYRSCPSCGHVNKPAARTAPEFVDGDLAELDPATLRKMRGEVENVDALADAALRGLKMSGAAPIVIAGAVKQHKARQAAQTVLRDSMQWWAGWQQAHGYDVSQSQRLFFHAFGIDVLSAQALGRPEAEALTERIDAHITKLRERLSA